MVPKLSLHVAELDKQIEQRVLSSIGLLKGNKARKAVM